jgi:hypothetical protein
MKRAGWPERAEIDAASAAWLEAVAAALATPEEHVLSPELDLGGHELALLDFDPADLDRLRRIGRLIEIPDEPDVSTALAISGSSAQARIHPFPADADFFERVHILAPDRARAVARFAELVRANALATIERPELGLDEICFGRSPWAPGQPLRWTAPAVRAGFIGGPGEAGGAEQVTWESAAADPGFVKLDWWLLEPDLGGPAKVSKVIDATWEGSDGRIESLDGLIDGGFQEVYLSAGDASLAAQLVRHAAPDLGRAVYLAFMDQEIAKYLRLEPPDYVKVAKRLYNRCRLTGHYQEALWLRRLFEQETAGLVQLRTAIHLAIYQRAIDPIGLPAHLRTLVERFRPALETGGCLDAARRCLDLPPATAAVELIEAITCLDRELAAALARLFGDGLRANPSVAALLQQVEQAVPIASE